MGHDYYGYDKERLLESPKMRLYCLEDNEAVFRQMAGQMVQEIEKNKEIGKRTVFICPVGPVGQYPYFVDMVNEKGISLKDVWFINMDEYLDDSDGQLAGQEVEGWTFWEGERNSWKKKGKGAFTKRHQRRWT